MAFGTLLLLHPDGSRVTLSLEKTTIRVGRAADNDVVLAYPQVADYHVQILCDTTGVQVLDLGSPAGTAIDDQPLEQYGLARFGFGQRLQTGPVWMLLYREAEPPPAPEPPRSRWSWPPAWWLRWREQIRARNAQTAMVPISAAAAASSTAAPASAMPAPEVSEPAPGLIQRVRNWHVPDWLKRIFIWGWLKQNGHRALAWFLGLVGFFWLRNFLSRWLGISPDVLNPLQLLDERKEAEQQPRANATPGAAQVSTTAAWHEPQHGAPPTPPTILVRRSEQMHLTLEPAELATDPGRAVALTVTVVNRSPLVDRVSFLVDGLPATWVSITPPALSLMPGDSGCCEIVIRPPRDANSVAGTHPFVVAARSSDETEPGSALAASLTITPFHDFRLDFQPQQRSAWWRGRYELRIINNSNQAQAFVLQGRDEAQVLRFDFQPTQPLVTPGQIAPVQVTVRRRRPHLLGKSIASGFYLMVEPTHRATPAQQTQGQLIQRAISWSLLLLLLLLPVFAYSLQYAPRAVETVIKLLQPNSTLLPSPTAESDSKSPSPSPMPTATPVSPTATTVTDTTATAATDSTSTATSATATAETAVAQVVATQVAATQTGVAQVAAAQQAAVASQTEAAAVQTASAAAATGTAQAQAGQTQAAAAQTALAVAATGTAQAYLSQTQTAGSQTAAAVAATANADAQIAAQIATQTQGPYATASAATATAQTQGTANTIVTAQARATATAVYVATSSAVAVGATQTAISAIATATAMVQPNSLRITTSNIDKNATENFSITVQVLDIQGNRANSNSPVISLKLEGFDAASLITAPSLSLNPSNGEVTFTNLQIKRAGVYRLYAVAPDNSTLVQKESSRITITISPGPASELAFVCYLYGNQTSCPNSPNTSLKTVDKWGFVGEVRDVFGNKVAYNGTASGKYNFDQKPSSNEKPITGNLNIIDGTLTYAQADFPNNTGTGKLYISVQVNNTGSIRTLAGPLIDLLPGGPASVVLVSPSGTQPFLPQELRPGGPNNQNRTVTFQVRLRDAKQNDLSNGTVCFITKQDSGLPDGTFNLPTTNFRATGSGWLATLNAQVASSPPTGPGNINDVVYKLYAIASSQCDPTVFSGANFEPADPFDVFYVINRAS